MYFSPVSRWGENKHSPEGKTEQEVNFLTSQRRVGEDVPEREEQQPYSGSNSPSGSCEICRCFEHVHKLQLFVAKHCIINHDSSLFQFLRFTWTAAEGECEFEGPCLPLRQSRRNLINIWGWDTTAGEYKHKHLPEWAFLEWWLSQREWKGPIFLFPQHVENLSCFFEAQVQLHGIVTKLIQCPCRGAARSDRINSVIESRIAEALMKQRVSHADLLFPVFN